MSTVPPFAPAHDDAGLPLIQHHFIDRFPLRAGPVIERARLGFCVFGDRADAPIVVLHPALTGSPRAAVSGRASQGDGWFSHAVGPKKFLDTERLTVVCVDHLGGNGASTGAEELAPLVGQLCFGDTVRLVARVLRERGVERIHAVVGGSIGGGQVFEWLLQDDVKAERLVDLQGNPCREGPAVEFFDLQADLLLGEGRNVADVARRLTENLRDLVSRSEAFDRVVEHVIAELRGLEHAWERTQALSVARKIGFLRFVTPYFFQRRWDDDLQRWTDEALALAGTRSWIDAQGEKFVHRFSADALASLCRMEARATALDAGVLAAKLREARCTLVGFSVGGDTLFDADAQFRYYDSVRAALPAEDRGLVDIFFAYDEVNGHDHFLTPRFLENVPRLARHLYPREAALGFETRAVRLGAEAREQSGALIQPIYLTAAFERGNRQGFDYTRSGNPNFVHLEETVASLENAAYATVFQSGVAAITAIVSTLKSGDVVLAEEVVDGCTYRLFEEVFSKFGVVIEYVDFTQPGSRARILERKPALVWVESPTNPLLKIIDIREVSKYTTRAGSTLVVDNTFASSFCQKPLDLGADVSVSSTTKYINGHSDCLGGVVCVNAPEWKARLVFAQKALGLAPSPFETWLITRGVKTLPLRMQQHESNAMRIVEFLQPLNCVRFVRYPLHPSHPESAIARAQMTGGSGVVAAQLDMSLERLSVFLNSLQRFTLAESLGGIESLICHPATMTHASVPKAQRERLGITDGLVRLSIGIERAEDLIDDLRQALREVGEDHGSSP